MQTQTRVTGNDIDRADATSANAEVNAEVADLCRTLEISIGAVKLLPTPVLLMFVAVRMFKKLSIKLRELDARLTVAEARREASPQDGVTHHPTETVQ